MAVELLVWPVSLCWVMSGSTMLKLCIQAHLQFTTIVFWFKETYFVILCNDFTVLVVFSLLIFFTVMYLWMNETCITYFTTIFTDYINNFTVKVVYCVLVISFIVPMVFYDTWVNWFNDFVKCRVSLKRWMHNSAFWTASDHFELCV